MAAAAAAGAPVGSAPALDIGVAGQSGEQGDHTFIERLYRSTNSYADRLTADELESIHVDLGVDDYLVAQAEAGRQIIVTGNPGDGKTHLIERLRPKLEALGRAGDHRRQRLHRCRRSWSSGSRAATTASRSSSRSTSGRSTCSSGSLPRAASPRSPRRCAR